MRTQTPIPMRTSGQSWLQRTGGSSMPSVWSTKNQVPIVAGVHDEGRGETDDLIAVARYATARFGALALTCAGFSFGGFVQTRVARQLSPQQLVLVAPAVGRFDVGEAPAGTLVIHGELDDVVPLQAMLDWARPQNLPVVVVPGGEHFFHGRLHVLQQIISRFCRP